MNSHTNNVMETIMEADKDANASPPTTIVDDVLGLFADAGFEVRPNNGQFTICGSVDSAGVLIDAVLEYFTAQGRPAGTVDPWPFIEEVSKQTPEKPDYWSSCGQCGSNAQKAEELLDQRAAIVTAAQTTSTFDPNDPKSTVWNAMFLPENQPVAVSPSAQEVPRDATDH